MPVKTFCTHCECVVRDPCRDQFSADNGLAVYAAAEWELRRIGYFQRLARGYARTGISRYRTLGWLNNTIMDFEGRLFEADGEPFCTPDTLVDDVFKRPGSIRWLSDFKKFSYRRPAQRPQRNVWPRLKLIDLALKIEALNR